MLQRKTTRKNNIVVHQLEMPAALRVRGHFYFIWTRYDNVPHPAIKRPNFFVGKFNHPNLILVTSTHRNQP